MSRDLLLLSLSMMTWGLGEGMFYLFQPLYLQELGASPIVIGRILGAVGIAMTVAHIPAGLLADRIGRRPMMWLAWITGVTATWVMALAPSLPFFVTGMILYGLTTFVMAPLSSYVTEARGNLSVGRALTLVSAFYNTGAILGPWLGGQIGSRLGLHSVYLIAACLFFISLLIILRIRPQPLAQPSEHTNHRATLFQSTFLFFIGMIFLATFATYLPQPLSPNFLQNIRQLDLQQIGQLGSYGSIGVVVLSLLLGHIPARWGFLAGQVCVAGFSLVLWRGSGMFWYAVGYFLLGGYRVVRSLATAQTRELIPPAWMGLAYGITETVGASVVIFAPPLAGALYEINPSYIFALSLGLILISLLASVQFAPASSQQAKAPASSETSYGE
ncbi:MAG: MFS transporter [Anaerolineales bacterium]|nr:MFS transporter [Anaerolineales bacterium]